MWYAHYSYRSPYEMYVIIKCIKFCNIKITGYNNNIRCKIHYCIKLKEPFVTNKGKLSTQFLAQYLFLKMNTQDGPYRGYVSIVFWRAANSSRVGNIF